MLRKFTLLNRLFFREAIYANNSLTNIGGCYRATNWCCTVGCRTITGCRITAGRCAITRCWVTNGCRAITRRCVLIGCCGTAGWRLCNDTPLSCVHYRILIDFTQMAFNGRSTFILKQIFQRFRILFSTCIVIRHDCFTEFFANVQQFGFFFPLRLGLPYLPRSCHYNPSQNNCKQSP